MGTTQDISFSVECADCLQWLPTLPADSCDLVFGSPPYEDCRTYGIGFNLKGQAWVDWMVRVFEESSRVSRGLVAFVLQGKTERYRWSATPALLMADLHRKGLNLRNPPIFHRVGIPGSGGPDWLRSDYEWIICVTRPGRLPWSDNTAMGHPPKWAPGGAMSHRLADGARVNQWGMVVKGDGTLTATNRGRGSDATESDIDTRNHRKVRPSHVVTTNRRITRGHTGGDTPNEDAYIPPAKANPGNVIACRVGGGLMGSELAHLNEAPFPESLAEWFVRSFAPPGGTVCDPFTGSGTTASVAVRYGRSFVGCDLRASQVALARRRVSTVTPATLSEGLAE